MKPNFFSNFLCNENVSQEPAQLLAETWCPYLLWVLRNLPHKFEKLAHVTKSAKKKRHHMGISLRSCPKNVTIWASRSARAPKTIEFKETAATKYYHFDCTAIALIKSYQTKRTQKKFFKLRYQIGLAYTKVFHSVPYLDIFFSISTSTVCRT